MRRKILIVDDEVVNRRILQEMLSGEYEIIEAANGKEALDLLCGYANISAVLLDIIMPGMDGFEVLERIRGDVQLAQIPVIITTAFSDDDAEVRAISLGANDFIRKPFNPPLIIHCLRNAINFRETASVVNSLQRDKLTGLYNRETFFEKASAMIQEREAGYYVMACFDIDNFKLVNDRYGSVEGDRILKIISEVANNEVELTGGILGRIAADNFAALYPISMMKVINEFATEIRNMRLTEDEYAISFSIGRHIVTDLSLSASALYDRAFIAKQSVKGRYDNHIAYFNEDMLHKLVQAQDIASEMDAALALRQFEIWFQPQYNHATGALVGAEALARWRHPEKGLIMPGKFIPVFEQNGFIYELDKYVWEEACRYLRKWIDEGFSPVPVSVNISRYDVLRVDLVDVLTGLLEKYGLTPNMLHLEIIESAFEKSTEQIIAVVKKLMNCGFTLEIDDFGSGYSSLNTLKDVPADVLKLDMRFLEDKENSQHGGIILASIVRMARWLDMAVIAEGVETLEQADYLKSIGCSYVQGYFYSKPMPAAEYEQLSKNINKESRISKLKKLKHIDNDSFWDPKSMETLIFNSYVGGAGIFEYKNEKIEMLRANEKFAQIMGADGINVEDMLKLDWMEYLNIENRETIKSALDLSLKSGDSITKEVMLTNFPGCPGEIYLRLHLQVIASSDDRYFVYCTNENISAQRIAEQKEKHATMQLQAIMNDADSGIMASVITSNENVDFLVCNDKYYEIHGYSREEYESIELHNLLQFIYPEDKHYVMNAASEAYIEKKSVRLEYRIMLRDGSLRWVRLALSYTRFVGVDEPVQICILNDITDEHQAVHELLNNMPCGAVLFEYDGHDLIATHLNNQYWKLVNRAQPSTAPYNLSVLDSVHPDDRSVIVNSINEAIAEERDVSCSARIRYGENNEYRPFRIDAKITSKNGGKYAIYSSYTPIEEVMQSFTDMLPIALSIMMSNSSDIAFVKDKYHRYICCSRSFLQMIGLENESGVIGKTDYDIAGEEYADKYHQVEDEIIASGKARLDYDEILPSEDGTTHYGKTSKYPLLDAYGNVMGIYGVTRDVTEYHSMFERLKLVTDSIPGGLATYACSPDDLKILYFNDGFCELFGFTREEYQKHSSENPMGMVFEDNVELLRGQIKRLLKENIPMNCVYRVHINGGGYKWINHKAVAVSRNGETMIANAILLDVTEQQEATERLRISEEENRLAVQHSGNIICRFTVADRTIAMSREIADIFSMPEKMTNVPYEPISQGFVSSESIKTYADFFEAIINGSQNGAAIFRIMISGEWRWVEGKYSTIFSDKGNPVSAVISFYDITERLEKETVYKKWQQSLSEKPPESYTLLRCNLNKNTSFEAIEGSLLNIDFAEENVSFNHRTADYVKQYVYEDDKEIYSSLINSDKMLANYYRGNRSETLEYREKTPDGGVRWLRLTIDLVEYPNSTEIEAYLMYEDINKAKLAELQTKELAETDPLTGLLNRVSFVDRMSRLIGSRSAGSMYALIMFDLDGFKLVNDSFGHAVGDKVLIDVAKTLGCILKPSDLAGRLGGDEFLVCLCEASDRAAIGKKARQICGALRKSFSAEVHMSASLGIAVCPEDGEDFDTLYQKADIALYHVKALGKDNYSFYSDEMSDEAPRNNDSADEIVAASLSTESLKRRMLIVEDNKTNSDMLVNIFKNEFIIDTAADGNSALIRLRRYGAGISVVLLDLIMPGMDGFAVLEKMRSSPEMQSVPVIVVSGMNERETSLRTIKCGASDFVTKPIDPDLLRLRVASAVAKAENERLRAQNSFLALQGGEYAKYKAVLENDSIVMIEYDQTTEIFTYDKTISLYVAGKYNDRSLWETLTADNVADAETVAAMRDLTESVICDGTCTFGAMSATLKTPLGTPHRFTYKVIKRTDEYQNGNKLILTLTDAGDVTEE